MRKATIIARCLVNSQLVASIEIAEVAVRDQFADLRPGQDFSFWNREVEDSFAKAVISTVGKADRINVASFIADLDD